MAAQIKSTINIIRRPAVEARTGRKRSTIYDDVKSGTLTEPVRIGARAVGWPDYEIEAINAARIAGVTTDEIRALVTKLHAVRGTITTAAELHRLIENLQGTWNLRRQLPGCETPKTREFATRRPR